MTLPFGVSLPCPTFPCGALESGYVVFEFLACHLRVKLRGGDIGIPQNLAHAFYRHTVVQCHDSEAVAAEVKGNRLLDTALLRYVLYAFVYHVK